MKTQEILFASGLIAVLAGVGTTLATRAFMASPVRGDIELAQAVERQDSLGAEPSAGDSTIVELRMENANLVTRLNELEARLDEVMSQRVPLAPVESNSPSVASRGEAAALSTIDLPELEASVSQVLDSIKAREEADREAKRKEIQAQRIEERVTELQTQLGLNNRQASDMRTVLIAQDDQREALFRGMREGDGDPREMRESFRTIRDEANEKIQGFLTPDQYTAYQETSESDWGRRGGGDRGGPGGGDGGGRGGGGDRGRGR